MEKFFDDTLNKLETSINELEIEIDNPLQRIEAIIPVIMKCLSEVKEYVLKTGFRNVNEEIRFFKHQKPTILAKLIYYNTIYKIEAKKPFGGKQVMKACLNEKLVKLKRFDDENIEFLRYYRANSTYLDDKYFVRGQYDIKLGLDTFFFEADPNHSSSHDYKVANIIANDRLKVYIKDQIKNNNRQKKTDASPLHWTGTKAAATELIYGLHSQGVFNNANTDIVAIVRFFENHFNIDLGDFYHTFLELKARKMNRTKFLDNLRDALIKRMDEQDER